MSRSFLHVFVGAHIVAVLVLYGLAIWVGSQAKAAPDPIPAARSRAQTSTPTWANTAVDTAVTTPTWHTTVDIAAPWARP